MGFHDGPQLCWQQCLFLSLQQASVGAPLSKYAGANLDLTAGIQGVISLLYVVIIIAGALNFMRSESDQGDQGDSH